MRKKLELSSDEVADMLVNEAYRKNLIPQVKTKLEWAALKVNTELSMNCGKFTAEISWEAK